MKQIKKYIFKKIRIVLAIFAVVAMPFFSGCGSSSGGYLVNLEIWGPFDDSMVYSEIINQYKKINPYVGEIKYRKFNQQTYKQELIDALASGQGPDIFMINNTWFPSFENKLYPAPNPFVSPQDVKTNFPDVVYSDFVSNEKVYAVPLFMDSMQLYYNKDMLNAAGISYPPKTWQEFQDDVKILTNINEEGKIVRAGAAIGTSQNINRASDLISMLMLQNEVDLPKKKGDLVKFDEGVVSTNGTVVQAGEQVLGYYTQFAKLNSSDGARNPLYTWNSKQPNSVDAFASGSAAMMVNYSWQNSNIKIRNPKLNYAVTAVPQVHPEKPVTIANYWGYAVSLNKVSQTIVATSPNQVVTTPVTNDMRAHEAWEFLRFLTLKNTGTVTLYNAISKQSKDFVVNFDPALDYLKRVLQPAARRDIIESQKSDSFLGPFASGNLFAKNWYQKNPETVDIIFASMIDSVNNGGLSLHEALVLARNRINSL